MGGPVHGVEEMTTARLSLRRPAPADVDAILSINGNERACVHNPSDAIATREQARQLFLRWDEHWRLSGFGYWVVRRNGTDAPIGFCGIKAVACRRHGTTLRGFLPRAWDRPVASYGTTCLIPGTDSSRSSDLGESGINGIPGGCRD